MFLAFRGVQELALTAIKLIDAEQDQPSVRYQGPRVFRNLPFWQGPGGVQKSPMSAARRECSQLIWMSVFGNHRVRAQRSDQDFRGAPDQISANKLASSFRMATRTHCSAVSRSSK